MTQEHEIKVLNRKLAVKNSLLLAHKKFEEGMEKLYETLLKEYESQLDSILDKADSPVLTQDAQGEV